MTQWAIWGTLVNTVAVLAGAALGLLIAALAQRIAGRNATGTEGVEQRPGARRIADTIQKGLGLCVLLIGISGALKVQDMLVMIVSIVLGTLVGELLDLDGLLCRFGSFVESKFKKGGSGRFAEGFVSATLLFCVGAMTVTGALESGLLHTHSTYYAKAMIDMVSAVIFAFSLGAGVMLSAAGVFAVQGLLVLIAVLAGNAIPALVTGEIMAVGSLLIIAIGTNLIGITKIRVMNLAPSMLFPLALVPLFSLIL